MIRPTSKFLFTSLMTLGLGIGSHGNAAIFLTQNFSGTLGTGNTFGGEPLADGTAISYAATFDTTPTTTSQGAALFSVTDFSLTIAGHGTYTVDPAIWSVVLLDPSNPFFTGFYLAGLSRTYGEDETVGFYSGFPSATPSFDAANPVPTVFLNYQGTLLGNLLTIDLPGVTGGLGIAQLESVSSMSITPVPEPVETAVTVGLSLVAYTFIRRKRATAVG